MSHVIMGVRSNGLTLSNVIISDIGFIIPFGGTTITYTDDLDVAKLLSSGDLVTFTQDNAYPAAGPGNTNTLILTDGTNDIPPGGVNDFLGGLEQGRRNNCDAITNPAVTDDDSIGYAVCSRWVNTLTGEAWMCTDATAGAAQWVRISGVVGNEYAIILDFAYNDASPKVFGTLNLNDTIINSEIEIFTDFDDVASLLQLSITGQDTILATGDVDATLIGTYGNETNYTVSPASTLTLAISPGSSTQGAGRVTVSVRSA